MAPRSEPDVYFPYSQRSSRDLEIAIRSRMPTASLASPVRREVASLDAGLPIYGVQMLETAVRQQTATGRFGSLVLTVFSTVALVLAAVGLYGVLAFLVSLSGREIAIRMALGATAANVLALTVRLGMTLVAVGLVLGLVGATFLTEALSSQLYEVRATDPATFAGVSLVLLLVALVASYLPARRATRVDPQLALRSE